jgi:hypothetical protein
MFFFLRLTPFFLVTAEWKSDVNVNYKVFVDTLTKALSAYWKWARANGNSKP